MSKLNQLSMWAFGALLPLALAVPVSAQSMCEIGFTGPNSNNECTTTTKYTCEVKNDTNVTVNNENVQIALSGNATGSGNTTSGSVRTGSATNSNNVTFTATVTNPGVCSVVATVPATPAPTAPVGGSGAAVPSTPAPVKQPVKAAGGSGAAIPTALANTGNSGYLPAALGMLSFSGLLYIASRIYANNIRV